MAPMTPKAAVSTWRRSYWTAGPARAALAVIAQLSFAIHAPAAAQPIDAPYLVRDIQPAVSSDLSAGSVTRLEESLADWVPFWTAPGTQAAGLWATDGTTAGTRLLTDLVRLDYGNWAFGLCFSGQTWYFWNTDSDGIALWRTEGSNATTELVARWPAEYTFLTPFQFESKSCSRHSGGGQILFWLERELDMSNYRVELWSTDGSTAGTHFLRDLGLDTYYHNALMTFAQHGDKVEFSLQVADNGYGLWESDGTAAGTVEIVEAPPEAPTFWPTYLLAHGDRTYFRSWAASILDGMVFGYTDGTPQGTHFFPELRLEEYYFNTPGFTFAGDYLTFPSGTPAGWAIYSIGPDEAAPSAVKSYPAGSAIRAFSWQEEFTVEGKAVFLAVVPLTPSPDVSYETRLVATGGTVATTEEIATFCPGGEPNCEILPVGKAGEALVFLERTPTGCNLWRTNGAVAGTVQVQTLGVFCPGYPFTSVSAGPRVYFFAEGLWASDGTASGTERVVPPELLPGSGGFDGGAAPFANGDLVFALDTVSSGAEPWFSDGTAAGTRRLADLTATAASSAPQQIAAGGGRVVMFANDGEHGLEPWVSDGSAAGTLQLADAVAGPAGSAGNTLGYLESSWPLLLPGGAGEDTRWVLTRGVPGDFESVLGAAPFSSSIYSGHEHFQNREVFADVMRLWSVEESPARANLLADNLYFTLGYSTTLDRGERGLYFARRDSGSTPGVWVTDGTAAGTRLFCSGPEALFGWGLDLVELGDGVIFRGAGDAATADLWVCDAPSTAARPLNLPGSGVTTLPAQLTRVGSYVVFAATDPSGDRELWRTDGTSSGTVRVLDIAAGFSSQPDDFFAFAGGVLFSAIDATHGRELWSTDGTAEGTRLVGDLAPALTSSSPADFHWSQGMVVFAAGTTATGRELWVTAGTPESTRLLADVNPGPVSSSPAELTPTAERIFFRATDPQGTELWALCPSWVPGIAQACNELFADGFEGGSPDLWSASTP